MTSDVARLREVRRRFSWGLVAWSVGSVASGAGVWAWPGGAFWGAVGVQFVVWGAIDLVFAWAGVRQAARADRRRDDGADSEEGQALLKSLRISHAMNWMWLALAVGLGVWAAVTANPGIWGHAVGVGIQAGFLFVYDRLLDRSVRGAFGRGALVRGAIGTGG